MHPFSPYLLVAALLLGPTPAPAIGAQSDKALASYRGGAITADEFQWILRSRFGEPGNSPPLSGEQHREVLEEEALVRLAAMDAVNLGYDRSEEFLKRIGAFEEQVQIQSYAELLQSQPLPARTAIRLVELQFVYKKSLSGDAAKSLLVALNDSRKSRAALDRLAAGETDLAQYGVTAGYLPPQCADCLSGQSAFLVRAVENAARNRFVHFTNTDGHWFVRQVGAAAVPVANLAGHFKRFFTKQHADIRRHPPDRAKSDGREYYRQMASISEDVLEALADANAAKIVHFVRQDRLGIQAERLKRSQRFELTPYGDFANLERGIAGSYPDDTVLFTLNDAPYTYAQLNARLPNSVFSLYEQLINLHFIALHQVLLADSRYRSVTEERVYDYIRRSRWTAELSGFYFDKQINISPPPDQRIEQEFHKRQDTQFREKSLAEVREEIAEYLNSVARHEARTAIRERLTSAYGLHLHTPASTPSGTDVNGNRK